MAQITGLFGLYEGGDSLTIGTLSGLKLDAGDAVSLPSIFSAGPNDPAITYLGGVPGDLGPLYPRYLFDGVTNLTLDDGTRNGIGGTVAFRTDAVSFNVATYAEGTPADFRVFVDGELAEGDTLDLPSDGSLRMVHADLSALGLSPGMHQIDLVYSGTGAFGGIELPAGTSIAPIAQTGPRIVFLGDSFTEGTGSAAQAIDYDALTGRLLGADDIWQSGEGGTGYATPFGNRPSLEERIQSDGVAAQGDIYVVAMGLNDPDDYAVVYAAARASLTALSSGEPDAKIFVVADWNPIAPTGTLKPNNVAAIQAATEGLANVVFLDPSNVAYTKSDPTHPDQAGHEVLADWLTTQIRTSIGADGVVEQNVAGDEVGPLFVQGWSASEHYTYQVLENGQPSTRFEVVDSGNAFPVLQLLPGQAIVSLGTIAVTMDITDAEGHTTSQVVSFAVRAHPEGTAGENGLAGIPNDFNGNGHSDILWQNSDGALSTWEVSGDPGNQVQQAAYNTYADPSWRAVETGDFNGDGFTDVLWRNTDGALSIWDGASGGALRPGAYDTGSVTSAWQIDGTGDIDGDGADDILWRNQDGAISVWSANGNQFNENTYYHPSVDTSWKVEGLADFNGDGKTDILWRNDSGALSIWTSTGRGFDENTFYDQSVSAASGWHVVSLGDFNGDGKVDILWRNDSGALSIWTSTGAGFDKNTFYDQSVNETSGWHVAAVGDFNGDGRTDILWRNDDGAVSTWESNGTGFAEGVYNSSAATNWTIVAHSFPL